jgi:hypothetical protein
MKFHECGGLKLDLLCMRASLRLKYILLKFLQSLHNLIFYWHILIFFVVSNTTHVVMDIFLVPTERPPLGLVGCFVVEMFKMIKLVINMCFHFTFNFQGYLYIVIIIPCCFFNLLLSN